MQNHFKSVLCALLAALVIFALSACDTAPKTKSDRLTVVCSLFPVYDFTRLIAGGRADVYQLLPPGQDSHDYEPGVGDMVFSDKADLFIYVDDELENWISRIADGFTSTRLVRCAEGIDLEALNEDWEEFEHAQGSEDHEEHEHGHEHKYDAHIWLDPTLCVTMCRNIRDALIGADPEGADEYRANCDKLTGELEALDREFARLFASHPDALLCFGGSFAYSHFLRRYNVDFISAFDSCGGHEEVSLASVIGIIRLMRENKARAVFTDELSNGLIAREIAGETGAKLLVFNSCHSPAGQDAGKSYIQLMRQNYDNILQALEGT